MSIMKVHLSNSVFLGNIEAFLANFDPSDPSTLNISFNKKWIFVHPVALTMVAALAFTVDPKKINCEKLEARSGHYLARMGLFDFLKIKNDISFRKHEPAGRFIPLTQIKNSDELSKFLKDMVPLLHLEPHHAESIRYIMSELVRNVLEHAQSEHGAILAAQYFKKSNTIRIGIADAGCGIKKTINYSYNAPNDLAAIMLALQPGVTGKTRKEGGTSENAGAGLFFIKSIAYVNRNFFMLYSGDAMYKLRKRPAHGKQLLLYANPSEDLHTERGQLPNWKGTAVGIDISLDTNKAFTSLLDLVKSTYSKAIRERRKAQYKKPRFT